MFQAPGVSVVMINRNYEDMVGDAIESVLGQTWKKWELIIVDNSTDESMKVIKRFKDIRIKTYHTDRRIYPGAARNMGIENSNRSFRYIAYLDSDDIWYPDHLEVEARYLNIHPLVGLVSTDLWDEERSQRSSPFVKDKPYPYIIRPSSWMHRRVLIRHIGYWNPSLLVAEDLEWHKRITRSFWKVGYIDKVTLRMRYHPRELHVKMREGSLHED